MVVLKRRDGDRLYNDRLMRYTYVDIFLLGPQQAGRTCSICSSVLAGYDDNMLKVACHATVLSLSNGCLMLEKAFTRRRVRSLAWRVALPVKAVKTRL